MTIRVAVAGAAGRTGRAVAAGLHRAEGIELVSGLALETGDLGEMLGQGNWSVPVYKCSADLLGRGEIDVWVDFTLGHVAGKHALEALKAGVRPVVGATGIPQEDMEAIKITCREQGLGGAVVPNFCIGSHLMSEMVQRAANVYKKASVVEIHHDQKLDAPSGTALRLQAQIRSGGIEDMDVHSLRLPGFLAHHLALFGSEGESLTVRHDIIDRQAFVPGVILAIRGVLEADRLITDLGQLMD